MNQSKLFQSECEPIRLSTVTQPSSYLPHINILHKHSHRSAHNTKSYVTTFPLKPHYNPQIDSSNSQAYSNTQVSADNPQQVSGMFQKHSPQFTRTTGSTGCNTLKICFRMLKKGPERPKNLQIARPYSPQSRDSHHLHFQKQLSGGTVNELTTSFPCDLPHVKKTRRSQT